MGFDVEGARKAGYSDTEIAEHLAAQKKFDVAGARKAGYSDAEILAHLQPPPFSDYLHKEKPVTKFLAGLPEATLQMVTQGGRAALAGAAGIGQMVVGPPGSRSSVDRVMQAVPTFEPRSDLGKGTSESIGVAGEKLEGVKEGLGTATLNATGSPALATAAHMAPDVALALIGAKGPGLGKPKFAIPAKGSAATDIADLFRSGDKGAERILTRHQRRIIGDEARQAQVSDALEGPNAAELVAGSKPTAAEAVSQVPAGSPVVAHQAQVSKVPGGPSAAFGERLQAQETARVVARKSVEDELGPVRDKILEDVNVKKVNGKPAYRSDGKGGFEPITGVDPTPVAVAMAKVRAQPGLKGREVVAKTLDDIEARVSGAKNRDGLVDAHELYGIRKDLGEMIQKNQPTALGKPKPGSKRLATTLEKSAQHAIDDAIEAAGGKGWKDTLKQYSDRLGKVDADAKRAKFQYKPPQRTNVAGPPIGQQAKPEMPNLLSRTAMGVNFVLKKAGRDIESKIDRLAAERYLDPKKLAEALRAEAVPQVRRVSAKGAAAASVGPEAERRRRLAEALRGL